MWMLRPPRDVSCRVWEELKGSPFFRRRLEEHAARGQVALPCRKCQAAMSLGRAPVCDPHWVSEVVLA